MIDTNCPTQSHQSSRHRHENITSTPAATLPKQLVFFFKGEESFVWGLNLGSARRVLDTPADVTGPPPTGEAAVTQRPRGLRHCLQQCSDPPDSANCFEIGYIMYNLDGLSRTRGCCLFSPVTRVIQLPTEEQAFPLNISHKDPEI